ncbi:MAG TPA: TonB-dependent receptor [Sulfuricurvum sp.]|nr:TonB-dependent receptor [Sulfuricurvum sp.]
MGYSLGAVEHNTATDATAIPLEELLQIEYIPASHIANQVSNASSAVSIVTAEDIRDYGYRTLAEILASMKGLHLSYAATYGFLGGRGFPNNEYAGRIIVLIDGYRADDSLYGQAYLGNDGILDVSMIERVEYIPGGGSAGYGDGALLGAINIITKKGSDIDGTRVTFGFGNHHARQQRISYGEKLDNGANILLGASAYATRGSVAKAGDNDENNKRFFAKYDADNVSFLGAYVKRNIQNPTYAPTDSLLYSDENAFLLLKYHTDIASDTKLSTSFWYGQYTYSFDYMEPQSYSYGSISTARWNGGDAKLIGSWVDNHTISLGVGYRNDYLWSWNNYSEDLVYNYSDSSGGEHPPRKTYSFYAYDDFVISPTLSLNYGLRYENSNNNISYYTPRAALIYQPSEESVFKLSAGKTNRQATPSEGAWTKEEQARTVEFVIEQQLGWGTKLSGSLYRYRIRDRISYGSTNDVVLKGAEVELEKHWDDGIRLKASYARQNGEESDGAHLGNSPENLAKFNLSTPLLDNNLRVGLEAQYVGKYLYYTGSETYHTDYTLVNCNLLAHRFAPNTSVSFLVHDMFNQSDKEATTYLPQSGRTFWLQLEYNFQ